MEKISGKGIGGSYICLFYPRPGAKLMKHLLIEIPRILRVNTTSKFYFVGFLFYIKGHF